MVHAIQSKKEIDMNTILKKLVWLVILVPGIYLAIVWNQLPERIVMHYDIKGNPDRIGSKNEIIGLVAVIAAVSAFVYLLLTNMYKIDPKTYAAENKDRLARIAFAIVVFLTALACLAIYTSTAGAVQFNIGLVFSGVGLLFAVIGNYMPNLKPNYFAGLRLPWTLENPDNWKKTHLLAGRLWFAGGLLIAIICLFTPPVASIIIFSIITLTITIIPAVFSYRLYKSKR